MDIEEQLNNNGGGGEGNNNSSKGAECGGGGVLRAEDIENTFISKNQDMENDDGQLEEEDDDDDDTEMNSDNDNEKDDDDDDAMSEYSYCISDDDDDGGGEEGVYNPAPPAKQQTNSIMMPVAGAKRKAANNPLAELDAILNGIKDGVEASTSRSSSPIPPPNNNNNNSSNTSSSSSATDSKTQSAATATTTTTSSSSRTSTGHKGVGYEMGTYNPTNNSLSLNSKMNAAAKKQEKEDEMYSCLLERMVLFLEGYDGSEGMVLLALKMSPSFNRMLFNLLKNDSILEWGKRKKIYNATLSLLDKFSGSQFYVAMLLHNLLEGNGLPDDGKATCHALLETLYQKAVILSKLRESNIPVSIALADGKATCSVILSESQKKLAATTAAASTASSAAAAPASADDNEDDEDAATLSICEKIISSTTRMNAAIKSGRDAGIVVNPENELTSKDVTGSGPTHLMNALLAEAESKPPPTLEEEKATYVKEMTAHRLKHVEILKAVTAGGSTTALSTAARYKFYTQATSTATSGSSVKKNRMLHIAGEVAGLSADLPVEWYSGIFVRVDEDRPDILKALIIAPEGTPYENGCFEFDILLPLNYPDVPPKVNIITTASSSVRFNPNLYNDGKVCLSLLGTWSGPGWMPGTSTLLQVLLSIQSLIFVEKPYWNEPGYDVNSPSQQAQSKQYDRQIRAATLKVAILGQMKNPSAMFDDCINDHFRLKKRRILEQLDEWTEMEEKLAGKSSSSLVAGGGIRCSSKIVVGICDEIRDVYDPPSEEEEAEGDDEGEKKQSLA